MLTPIDQASYRQPLGPNNMIQNVDKIFQKLETNTHKVTNEITEN